MALIAASEQLKLNSLAANQLGIVHRAFTLRHQDYVKVYINPRINSISLSFKTEWEKSMSFPFMRTLIGRYKTIDITYLDMNLKDQVAHFDGEESRRVQ